MARWIPLLIIPLALIALYMAARRATTIAALEIEDGEVKVLRGGIAPSVLSDLKDIARKPAIRSARIRIMRVSGSAETSVTGEVSREHVQRIRNVIGSVPLARLINARKK